MTNLPAASHTDPDALIVGDLNIDLATPEPLPGSLLRTICDQWGVLMVGRPTRKGRGERRELDGGIVPPACMADWTTTATATPLSDHALVSFCRGRSLQSRRPTCTPANFWALPEEARVALRRGWGVIAQALQVPLTNERPQDFAYKPRQEPGCPAHDDHSWETAQPVLRESHVPIVNLHMADNAAPSPSPPTRPPCVIPLLAR